MVNTLLETIEETSFSSWLREYIEYAGLKNVCLTLTEVREAVLAASLEYTLKTDNVQELLSELDSPVIIE